MGGRSRGHPPSVFLTCLLGSGPLVLASKSCSPSSGQLCPGSHTAAFSHCSFWLTVFLRFLVSLASIPTVNTSCVRPGSSQGGEGLGWARSLSIWSVSFLHGSHSGGPSGPAPAYQTPCSPGSLLSLAGTPSWSPHMHTHLQVPEARQRPAGTPPHWRLGKMFLPMTVCVGRGDRDSQVTPLPLAPTPVC